MYQILFYKDKRNASSVLQYMQNLGERKDKDSRIKFNKIQEYIQVISLYGTMAGEPYIKPLDGEIWELRPLRDRILFAAWCDGKLVLLHHFMKTTQKTPKREIEKAKKEFADFLQNKEE